MSNSFLTSTKINYRKNTLESTTYIKYLKRYGTCIAGAGTFVFFYFVDNYLRKLFIKLFFY